MLTASGSAGSTSYAYNGDGLTASVADAAGTTGYTYDSAGRLSTLADPATGTTATYSYNADSLVTGISNGSGKDTRSLGYDGLHRLTSDTLKTASGTTVASIGYGYNPDGLLTSETTSGLAGPASSTYAYDQAGRLTSWNNGTTTTQYGYDGNGNLTQNGTKTLTYDARDQLTSDGTGSYAYTARGTPSSESSPSGTLSVTFDAYGDQATAGTRAYAYDALGRLTADTPTSGGSGYQFSYVGASGTIASDGTSAYVWDPAGSVLAATGAPGGGTGGALALTDIHRNQAGQFTPAGSTLAGSKAYDPWGTVTGTSGFMTGMLGYQSAWADPASGKNLMGARWYSPAAGDFTSADTVHVSPDPDPAAGNPFAYAADNPLTGIDPTGHMALIDVGNTTIQAVSPKLIAAAAAAYQAAAKAAAAKAAAAKAAAAKAAAAKAAAAKAAAAKAAAAKAAAAKAAAAKAAAAKAAAAKIPTYCAGNTMAALGTCMSAVYRAAGGQVNASGVPTGKGYNATTAAQALKVVQSQYNASLKKAAVVLKAPGQAKSSSANSSTLCSNLPTGCEPCQSADATECYNLGTNQNTFASETNKPRDGGGVTCGALVRVGSIPSLGCTVTAAASGEEAAPSDGGSGSSTGGDAPGVPNVAGMLKALGQLIKDKPSRTVGVLDFGTDEFPLISGSNPSDNQVYSDINEANTNWSHVEQKAASIIRANPGIRQAVLYVDYQSGACPTCARSLPGLLPKGFRLWVYGSDGALHGPGGGVGPFTGTR